MRSALLALPLIALPMFFACGKVLEGVDGGIDAAPDVNIRCTAGPFSSQSAVAELNSSSDERGLRLSSDERRAVFWRADNLGSGNAYDRTHIFVSERSSPTGAFGAPAPLQVALRWFDGGAAYPSFSGDALSLYFESSCEALIGGPVGNYSPLCQAERDAATAPFTDYWGLGMPLASGTYGLGASNGDGFVTSSGRTYYYVSANDSGPPTVNVTQRSDAGAAPWGQWFSGPYVPVFSAPDGATPDNPVPSADELTLYVSVAGPAGVPHIRTTTRATTTDPFGPSASVSELDSDEGEYPTWLSADNCRLYFTRKVGGQWDLYVATRSQ